LLFHNSSAIIVPIVSHTIYAIWDRRISMAKKQELSLEEALGTLAELLYSPKGTTQFWVSQEAYIPSNAKANWLREQLPLWESRLNSESGARVKDIEVRTPNPAVADRHGNFPIHDAWEGRILINMVIDGSINTDRLKKEMATAVSGAAKKLLALDLLERFPPPFPTQYGSPQLLVTKQRVEIPCQQLERRMQQVSFG
jgi:hypothetical protein